MLIIYLLLALLLLLLNALFVLAEFAAVKARPTQMEALADKGNAQARIMQNIQANLDQYLSVCQIGITLASIGLGFVGEPAIAELIRPVLDKVNYGKATEAMVHGTAVVFAYMLVSFLHIVLGELVPKSMAIRRTEQAALLIARPLVFFHYLFRLPLVVLNLSANACMHLLRIPPVKGHQVHSEDEVRLILDDSQTTGMMSLRRLLFIENILDMGNLKVRNAMRSRPRLQWLETAMTEQERNAIIHKSRYSRYPVLGDDKDNPLGHVHIKDLYLGQCGGEGREAFQSAIKPCLKTKETEPLENLLAEMQRKGQHLALVYNEAGKWSGIITLEDVLEEIVGTIEEEYPVETSLRLAEVLSSPSHVIPDVEGETISVAVTNALKRLGPTRFPLPQKEILFHIAEREKVVSSYVGHQLAIPHARLKNLDKAMVFFCRMKTPIEISGAQGNVKVSYLFILLTPENQPRIHQVLLSHIARLFDSGFFESRLEEATTAQQLFDAINLVEQSTDMTL